MSNKALLVGINRYQPASTPRNLNGCINDVTNMRNVLKTHLGFENEDIRMLVDERATRTNIIQRLNWLIRGVKAGDFLLFQFSGFGSQIRAREGDALSDRMEEVICPHDMNWDDGFITDDELNGIFKKLPQNVLLEVVLDTCHCGPAWSVVSGQSSVVSGQSTNNEQRTTNKSKLSGQSSVEGAAQLTTNNQQLTLVVSRYWPPPADIMARFEGDEDQLKPMRQFKDSASESTHYILWAACQDLQTSAEAFINGSYNGAFTYYFCRNMRASGGSIARNEMLKRLRQSLLHDGYSQNPQLECETALRTLRTLATGEKRSDGRIEKASRRLESERRATTPALASHQHHGRTTTVKLAK